MNGDQHWHLDKRVPVGIIITILLQTIALTVFLVGMRKDIDSNTALLEDLKQVKISTEANSRVTALEGRTSALERETTVLREGVSADLQRIEEKLDRLIERSTK